MYQPATEPSALFEHMMGKSAPPSVSDVKAFMHTLSENAVNELNDNAYSQVYVETISSPDPELNINIPELSIFDIGALLEALLILLPTIYEVRKRGFDDSRIVTGNDGPDICAELINGSACGKRYTNTIISRNALYSIILKICNNREEKHWKVVFKVA